MIRVLRVLEYEYETGEGYAHDSARWTSQIAVGHTGMAMRSAVVSVTEVPSIDVPIDLVPAEPIFEKVDFYVPSPQPGVDFIPVGDGL